MACFDIIPDIHGQSSKLRHALTRLGWRRGNTGWQHSDPNREIVFLGDFIDRGPDNAGVIAIVRDLVDSGKARAVMGNHELNALHFHIVDPIDGKPLRRRSEKNTRQHQSFLDEFPLDAPQTMDVLGWMATLPLYLEFDTFRAVHACWDEATTDKLNEITGNGILSEELLIRAGGRDSTDVVCELVDRTLKGPEHLLPDGYTHTDKAGSVRRKIRLQWWNGGVRTWRDIAISVTDIETLPVSELPEKLRGQIYPPDAKPVFFGHYWLSGAPQLQAHNALCLDYSAGLDGPLVTYLMSEEAELSLDHIFVHEA